MKVRTAFCILTAATISLAFAGGASAQARFGVGDTGVFGCSLNWNNGATLTVLDYENPRMSMRFTSLGSADVDGVCVRLVNWLEATDTVTMGLQADDGNGNPDGTYLASYVGPPVNRRAKFDFSGSASLTAGNVYHLVAEATSGGGKVYFSRMNDPDYRQVIPYDKRLDDQWTILLDYAGDPNDPNFPGGWAEFENPPGREPGFILYSGDMPTHDGMAFTAKNPMAATRYTVQNAGQTFGVTAAEIGANRRIRIDSIQLQAMAYGTPQTNLVATIRKVSDPNTILATTEMTPAQADGTVRTLALDQPILIKEGEDYLLMTDFAGEEVGNTVQYKLYSYRTDWEEYEPISETWQPMTSEGPATYGGTQWSEVTAPPGDLSVYTPVADRDVYLGFTGRVVIPGDANLDWAVNVGDLGILGFNYGLSGKDWGTADFNDDGSVNVGDLGILGAWYGTNLSGGGAVPEPATLALLAAAGLCLLRRRR